MKSEAHAQNKASKLSPEVETFVPKRILKEPGAQPLKISEIPDSASSARLCVQEPGVGSGLHSFEKNGRERKPQCPSGPDIMGPSSPTASSSLPTCHPRVQSKHIPNEDGSPKKYSSTRRGKKATQEQETLSGKQSRRVSSEQLQSSEKKKAPWSSTEPGPVGHGVTGRPSEGMTGECSPKKLGNRGRKSAPKIVERSRPQPREAAAFEVKLSDFPQLESAAVSVQREQKYCVRKEETTDPLQCSSAGNSVDMPLASSEDQFPEPNLCISANSPSSWATIASQPPQRDIPKKPASQPLQQNSATSQNRSKSSEGELQQVSEKKKKRKKKAKKPCDAAESNQPESPVVVQEPPKFEDEEEFPDLGVAFVSSTKAHSTATYPLLSFINITKRSKEVAESKGTSPLSSATPAAEPSVSTRKDKTPAHQPQCTEAKGQKAEKTSGKKSKVPVQLDLGNMLAELEKKQQSQKSKQDHKPVILSVGRSLPVVHKDPSTQKKHPRQLEKVAHNPLDSTSPLVKKGKQREVPKPKKPTPLKKIILKEREERKQRRLLEERGLIPSPSDLLPSADQHEGPCEKPGTEQDHHSSADTVEETSTALFEQLEEQAQEEQEPSSFEKDTEEAVLLGSQLVSNRPKIHSRRFREYCNQVLCKDVDNCVISLLKELVRFQDRLYQKDPMKARMKRRLVMGLREVLKHLKLRKVKCVIISPNCERIESKGGLDEALHNIIDTCREQNVPFVFALSRKALGRSVNKAVPVSLVGIFNYDGAQDYYHKMIELSSEARKAYEEMIASLENSDGSDEQRDYPANHLPVAVQSNGSAPSPSPSQMEEPEYIKIWKKMLEKNYNHPFLNFEEYMGTRKMDSESTLKADDDFCS
ncbi:selenocysteine insertion sequence-binding protein 2 isoform X2 [Lepisosteus oculatus]|uniref:selenocysteine insertion sequence-binding protein 2 isoform X2 n=1 Tax=Lepisosteus oculatus TaxID=7918 RepID=UPI00371971CE